MLNISQPTLWVDEEICRANIQRMAARSQKLSVAFRPHMKTHQSAQIGEWLRAAGVQAITVSSVNMASYFADHGWNNITIAFPCNLMEVKTIDNLAARTSLTVLVNSIDTAQKLDNQLTNTVHAYIELDTGSHRTGLLSADIETIEKLALYIQQDTQSIAFKGFYSHPGHSYNARSPKEIHTVHQSVLKQIKNLRDNLAIGSFDVCIGDTPCCSVGTNFNGVDAISPGNFVFYDLMQQQIGCCTTNNIATAVECPIVERNADRNEIAIYGGAIHFSKESLDTGDLNYGFVATKKEMGWQILDNNTYLSRLSQEHGIVKCTEDTFNQISTDNTLTILPVHSCLTAHLLKKYQLKNGRTITPFSS